MYHTDRPYKSTNLFRMILFLPLSKALVPSKAHQGFLLSSAAHKPWRPETSRNRSNCSVGILFIPVFIFFLSISTEIHWYIQFQLWVSRSYGKNLLMRLTAPRHCTQPLEILLITTFVWVTFSCQAPVCLSHILTSNVIWLNERSLSPLESVLFGAAWFEAQCFQGIYSSSCHSRPCLISAMARLGQVVPGLFKFTPKFEISYYGAVASSQFENLCLLCYWALVSLGWQSAESRCWSVLFG